MIENSLDKVDTVYLLDFKILRGVSRSNPKLVKLLVFLFCWIVLYVFWTFVHRFRLIIILKMVE